MSYRLLTSCLFFLRNRVNRQTGILVGLTIDWEHAKPAQPAALGVQFNCNHIIHTHSQPHHTASCIRILIRYEYVLRRGALHDLYLLRAALAGPPQMRCNYF